MNAHQEPLDLIILGGGPAGMAAALVAGRARLRTVVINAESPRNAVTKASHGFLTRDGAHPHELLAVAKEQLAPYTSVQYIKGRAIKTEKHTHGFSIEDDNGDVRVAHRLIVATGYKDDLSRLEMPGIEAVYGKSVYPCPFCDGFEHADERIAVFASDVAQHFVPVVQIWSKDVVVFSNGQALSDEAREALHSGGVKVVEARIKALISENGQLKAVETEDGQRTERDAGFVGEDFSSPSTHFAETLGVPKTTNAWGMEVLDADEAGKTAVEGLYLIGDSKSGFGGLMNAAQEGSSCVQHIVHEIATERWQAATQENGS